MRMTHQASGILPLSWNSAGKAAIKARLRKGGRRMKIVSIAGRPSQGWRWVSAGRGPMGGMGGAPLVLVGAVVGAVSAGGVGAPLGPGVGGVVIMRRALPKFCWRP